MRSRKSVNSSGGGDRDNVMRVAAPRDRCRPEMDRVMEDLRETASLNSNTPVSHSATIPNTLWNGSLGNPDLLAMKVRNETTSGEAPRQGLVSTDCATDFDSCARMDAMVRMVQVSRDMARMVQVKRPASER